MLYQLVVDAKRRPPVPRPDPDLQVVSDPEEPLGADAGAVQVVREEVEVLQVREQHVIGDARIRPPNREPPQVQAQPTVLRQQRRRPRERKQRRQRDPSHRPHRHLVLLTGRRPCPSRRVAAGFGDPLRGYSNSRARARISDNLLSCSNLKGSRQKIRCPFQMTPRKLPHPTCRVAVSLGQRLDEGAPGWGDAGVEDEKLREHRQRRLAPGGLRPAVVSFGWDLHGQTSGTMSRVYRKHRVASASGPRTAPPTTSGQPECGVVPSHNGPSKVSRRTSNQRGAA